jgi:hypothetical protein
MGARRMTHPTIRNTTFVSAPMTLTRGSVCSPPMLSATPNTMDTSSAARMLSPVSAPKSVSGISEEMKPVSVSSLVADSGTPLGSRAAGSMFIPAPGWKMLPTSRPISIDNSERTRK